MALRQAETKKRKKGKEKPAFHILLFSFRPRCYGHQRTELRLRQGLTRFRCGGMPSKRERDWKEKEKTDINEAFVHIWCGIAHPVADRMRRRSRKSGQEHRIQSGDRS